MNIKDEQPEAEASPETDSSPPPPKWEYRTELKINARMRELVALTKLVTEGEIDRLRRKVEKLKYGS